MSPGHAAGAFRLTTSALLSDSIAELYDAFMPVTVLLFASYADALGMPSVSVDVGEDATVADVLAAVRSLPGADHLPASPLVAVNQRYAARTARVGIGDEVAIIPPVAGG